MSDYIKREDAIEAVKYWDYYGITDVNTEDLVNSIECVQAADVVEVVHCQDCKYYGHYNEEKEDLLWCQFVCTDIDDYCSEGERADK